MYISGGENVYPAEVESVIHGHDAVAEAAVFGVPDDKWGEVGKAVVVLRAGARLTEEELKTYIKARIAGYKVPKSIEFVAEIPKTGPGKIDKRALKERYGSPARG